MNNAWSVSRGNIDRDYGHLPADKLNEWATHQADLSELYQKGEINGTSTTKEGRDRKEKVLNLILETLAEKSNMNQDEIEARMHQIDEHLEDPGLLENFEYFDIPSSEFMLQFYFAVWDYRIADVMDYLHNHGKDLRGKIRNVPENDVWYHMSYFECMNINERKKCRNVVDFIKLHDVKFATSFGGGNVPERFYGLPKDLQLTVFDDGPVGALKELFPNKKQRQNVNYVHESLANAPTHPELLGTQDLVWMHGVSMYLKPQEMVGAILCGAALLRPGGWMKYDFIIWTESIRRVIKTQNWPYDPGRTMMLFDDVASALKYAREILDAVNANLDGKYFMDALDPEITLIEPWGTQSLRFTVQKHARD